MGWSPLRLARNLAFFAVVVAHLVLRWLPRRRSV
jgi:hypothetical protein